ncbi:hypothetical protein [Micromonospora sp. NPDC048898]|uniref:hypothetical protein n=1 Tax=Micromonospora sp. NPDC048898 TaxID=3364260 RepID=UPI003710B943
MAPETGTELARRHGVHASAITHVLRAAGQEHARDATHRDPPAPLNRGVRPAPTVTGPNRLPLPRDEIVEAYLAGTSVNVLAQRHGVSRATLASRLDDWGVRRRGRTEASQAANRRPRPPAAIAIGPVPGDPDGYGRWAQLDASEDGQALRCHDCGDWKRALGTHAWYAHGITAAEYRQRHGLSTGQSLASPATLQRFAAMPQAQAGSTGRQALETNRDPDRARAAMTREGQHRPQLTTKRAQIAARVRQGRQLTAAEVDALAQATDIATWARVAQRLVDDDVRQAEISRATGIPKPTVSQRLRRRR